MIIRGWINLDQIIRAQEIQGCLELTLCGLAAQVQITEPEEINNLVKLIEEHSLLPGMHKTQV
jgi:hypothetical protein